MPIYEYKCKKCGNIFEVLQSTNKIKEICPKCKGEAKKLMSSKVGFVFKGSGFYITDYKNKKAPSTSESSKDKKVDKTPKEGTKSANEK